MQLQYPTPNPTPSGFRKGASHDPPADPEELLDALLALPPGSDDQAGAYRRYIKALDQAEIARAEKRCRSPRDPYAALAAISHRAGWRVAAWVRWLVRRAAARGPAAAWGAEALHAVLGRTEALRAACTAGQDGDDAFGALLDAIGGAREHAEEAARLAVADAADGDPEAQRIADAARDQAAESEELPLLTMVGSWRDIQALRRDAEGGHEDPILAWALAAEILALHVPACGASAEAQACR